MEFQGGVHAIPQLPKEPPVKLLGGLIEVRSLARMQEDELREAEQANTAPEIEGLAAYIRKCWSEAKEAKEDKVEPLLLKAIRQRRGEYDPDMLAILKEQGSTIIYMLLTSNKCRAAASWLREALGDMPWGCSPTPVSDIDDETKAGIIEVAEQQIQQAMMLGVVPTKDAVKQFMLAVRDQAYAKIQEAAKERADRMTEKMKDQLKEGGFEEALDAFIDDLVTFPAAILKGPVIRVRPMLKWIPMQNGTFSVNTEDAFRLEWERVDPFNIYPAPDATNIDDGYLIERHRLTRESLVAMRDVEGYSAPAINAVLDEYGRGGLSEWLSIDSERVDAEGKPYQAMNNPSKLIDALQFWGSVQGKLLLEWGMDPAEIDDPLAEYHIEAWLVGRWVIKATLNPDPLHRKPYYKTSWENIPGCFWGRSIPDLCADTQAICNAAARALVNNMSIASGPQVVYDISKLPEGENLTEMRPWKIWQYQNNEYEAPTSQQPISFFQPASNAAELMGIYEKFSQLADEYTGIPRYMAGTSSSGAGRTASGMSMLMTNAGKSIKNVVASVDRVLKPAIERLYFYNMMYLDDMELKGDVNIVADGAEALVRKQQQQQRQNEFLNIVASNPIFAQIVGQEGLAYMLREVAKTLGLDTDKIVPALPILRAREAMAQQQALQAQVQQQAMANQQNGQAANGGTPAKPGNNMDQRRLMDGTPQENAGATTPKRA